MYYSLPVWDPFLFSLMTSRFHCKWKLLMDSFSNLCQLEVSETCQLGTSWVLVPKNFSTIFKQILRSHRCPLIPLRTGSWGANGYTAWALDHLPVSGGLVKFIGRFFAGSLSLSLSIFFIKISISPPPPSWHHHHCHKKVIDKKGKLTFFCQHLWVPNQQEMKDVPRQIGLLSLLANKLSSLSHAFAPFLDKKSTDPEPLDPPSTPSTSSRWAAEPSAHCYAKELNLGGF